MSHRLGDVHQPNSLRLVGCFLFVRTGPLVPDNRGKKTRLNDRFGSRLVPVSNRSERIRD